jgi:ATP-dependent DNA helicase RecG
VLVFIVPSRPIGQVVQNTKDGIAWWRIGDSLVPMPDEVRRRIYEEGGHDFSADICHGAALDDWGKL